MADAVTSASIHQGELADFEAMSEVARKFETLDSKIKAALVRIGKTNEVLCLEISELSESTKKLHRRPTTGREVLLLIRKFFDIRPDSRRLYEQADLEKIPWFGDKQMTQFMAAWRRMLRLMREPPTEGTKRDCFFRKLRNAGNLKEDIAYYQRCRPVGGDKGHADYCYEFLERSVMRKIQIEREDQNHQDSLGSLVRRQPAAAATQSTPNGNADDGEWTETKKKKKKAVEVAATPAPEKGKGKGKGKDGKGKSKDKDKGKKTEGGGTDGSGSKVKKFPCYAHNTPAGCQRGTACNFEHRKMTAEEKTRQKEFEGTRSRSASPTPDKGVCYGWKNTGVCPRVGECKFSHPMDQKGAPS